MLRLKAVSSILEPAAQAGSLGNPESEVLLRFTEGPRFGGVFCYQGRFRYLDVSDDVVDGPPGIRVVGSLARTCAVAPQ